MRKSRATVLKLDSDHDGPIYKQLFDRIVAQIRTGAFPPHHRLPPTRDLAIELKVHRNTVVRAYEELEAAGFVTSTVGRGTFVVPLDDAPAPEGPSKLAEAPSIPWRSIASRAATAEPLSRVERLIVPSPQDDVINLSRMQPSPDLLPDELMHRCIDHVLRTMGPRCLTYAPPEGLMRLRGLIAEDLARQGVPAAAEDVVITTGSQQALDVLARGLVNPGEPFLVDGSTYSGALNLLSAVGAKLISVPSDDEGPDPGALTRLERSGAKGYYLMPNCHNPTGASITRSRREALVEWSLRTGVPLLEDDYGEGITLDDEPAPPALRAYSPEVVYIGTFSKKLIPALRIGFIVCPKPLRALLVPLKHAMDLGTSALIQHALAEFLDRGYLRAHLKKTVPEYRRRRDALEAALGRHLPREVQWRHPKNGVVLWLKVPPAIDPERLYREGLKKGVLIGPCTLNTLDGHPLDGVRLTFCAEPVERLIEGARRLGRAAHALFASARPREMTSTMQTSIDVV